MYRLDRGRRCSIALSQRTSILRWRSKVSFAYKLIWGASSITQSGGCDDYYCYYCRCLYGDVNTTLESHSAAPHICKHTHAPTEQVTGVFIDNVFAYIVACAGVQ